MQKTYSFNGILKEYNKEHNSNCKISPDISNAKVTYIFETDLHYVTYEDMDMGQMKVTLTEFVNYSVSPIANVSLIRKIIRSKLNNKLNLKIEIWPPSKIRYAYLYSNYYANDVGQLGKSCMRGKDMQKSLNFYIKNNVKIVVVTDDKNKIHARALLWDGVKKVKRKTPFTYLDRIYTNTDKLLSLFHKIISAHDWQAYEGTSAGNAKNNLYKDSLDIKGMCHFPYTDTFRYLYYKDNVVTSSSVPTGVIKCIKHSTFIPLTVTSNGGYFPDLDPNRVREVFTRDYISKKDAIFIKRYNGFVLKRHIVDINGNYYSRYDKDNIINTELDGYILKENLINEAVTNKTMNKNEAVFSINYNKYIHKSNVVNIGKNIYHEKDPDIIYFAPPNSNDTKWYHISDCFINYDRTESNKEIRGGLLFSLKDYCPYWVRLDIYDANKGEGIPRINYPIPKKHATIAYDFVYSPVLDDIIYQEVYRTNRDGLIQLVTGELIVNSSKNKQYLKKFNNKYYIKREFRPPNKNQLTLF